MLVFPQMDPTNFFPWKIRPKGAHDIQNGDETRTPGGRNSNMGHGGSKDLQKAPPLALLVNPMTFPLGDR